MSDILAYIINADSLIQHPNRVPLILIPNALVELFVARLFLERGVVNQASPGLADLVKKIIVRLPTRRLLELLLHQLSHELQFVEVVGNVHALAVLADAHLHVLSELAIHDEHVRGVLALDDLVEAVEVDHVVERGLELLLHGARHQNRVPLVHLHQDQHGCQDEADEDQLGQREGREGGLGQGVDRNRKVEPHSHTLVEESRVID